MTEASNEIFTVMLEPNGGCNLRCRHCYSDIHNNSVMSIENLGLVAAKVANYAEKQGFEEIHFIWHGGEPLLAGIDFFRQAMQVISKLASSTRQRHFIQNRLLTIRFFLKKKIG